MVRLNKIGLVKICSGVVALNSSLISFVLSSSRSYHQRPH